MIIQEKTIILKNGKKCVIKSPDLPDAKKMLNYLKKTSSETDFMVRYPEEITMNVEEEEKFLAAIREKPRSVMIGAFIDNELVGNSSIAMVEEKIKFQHRATFGIAVLKEAWELGIGTSLLSEIIAFARDAGYEQIELEVVSKNIRAVNLYKKYGFVIYGTRDNAFKFKDGTSCEEYLMMKKL